MTDEAEPSMFRTAEGQARYFAAYDASLALWPVPVDSLDVPTRFGRTHLHVCGAEGKRPLLLIPGQAISSTMWYPNVAGLGRHYRLYVPDISGDMGESISTRPFKDPVDFADWLTDLLDELQIAQTAVAGISYGGFIALSLALHRPERVTKLILLSPAGLRRIRFTFFLRMAAMFLPSFILASSTKQKLVLGVDSPQATPLIKQLTTPTDFQYRMYLPKLYKDEALRQVDTPTLLLLGAHEVVFNYQSILNRAARLMPHVETAVIPQAGHALSIDQPELVNEQILTFLAK